MSPVDSHRKQEEDSRSVMPTANVVRPCERTKEELHAELEELAQRYLSMSADAFLEAAKARRLPDTPAVRYMLILSGVAA